MNMKKFNYITSALLVLIAGYIFKESSGLMNVDKKDIGPGFYPNLIAGIMIILAIALFVQTLRNHEPEEKKKERSPMAIKPYIAMVLLVLYIFLMNKIGFIITSVLFMMILTYLFFGTEFRKNLLPSLCISVMVPVGIYLLFHNLLKVPLPRGILF